MPSRLTQAPFGSVREMVGWDAIPLYAGLKGRGLLTEPHLWHRHYRLGQRPSPNERHYSRKGVFLLYPPFSEIYYAHLTVYVEKNQSARTFP